MIDENFITCAVCGTFEDHRVIWPERINDVSTIDFSARRFDKRHYRIVKCKKCGLVYSNPIFNNETVVNLYKDSKFIMEAQVLNQIKTYLSYLKKVDSMVPCKDYLLEIGCGNGYFLKAAKEAGYKNVWGVEPSSDCLMKADPSIKDNIINDIFQDGLFPENLFDIVIVIQVIDHVMDPNELLRNIYKILKKDGVVLLISHNIKSTFNRMLGENSPQIDIQHIHLFDKKTIRQIFEKNNFNIVLNKNILYTYKIEYILKLFPFPSALKKIVTFIMRQFGIINKDIKWWGGNMVLVAKK